MRTDAARTFGDKSMDLSGYPPIKKVCDRGAQDRMASSAQDFFPMEGEAKVSENKKPGTAGPGELSTAIEPAWFMPEKILMVPIDELVPYACNARTHSDNQIAQLRASIREFGFINPMLIDSHKNIIAGRGRVLAAKAEGMTDVPCVLVERNSERILLRTTGWLS